MSSDGGHRAPLHRCHRSFHHRVRCLRRRQLQRGLRRHVIDLDIRQGRKTGFVTSSDSKGTRRVSYRDDKRHGEEKRFENGQKIKFPLETEEVFNEMKTLSKGNERTLDISGMTYDKIEAARGMPDVVFRSGGPEYEAWCLERLERDLWPLLPVPDTHKVVRRGAPVDAIADEAAAWRADVIVVGSHGKSWVDRLLIGSVTEALLNDLPAAVLVIPVAAPARQTAPARVLNAAPA